jgi:hypothetical protein
MTLSDEKMTNTKVAHLDEMFKNGIHELII